MSHKDVYEFIVVGAGIVGCYTAYHLSKAEKCPLIIEQFPLPHTRGSSHGQSRTIRRAYGGQEYYTSMVTEAYKLWQQLEEDSGIQLFRKTGLLCIGSSEDDFLDTTAKILEKNSSPYEKLDNETFKRRFSMLSYPPNTEGLIDKGGGILFPNKALAALQKIITKEGGKINDCEKVLKIIPGDIVTIHTNKGSYETKNLVLAAGAWSFHLLKDLGLNVPLKVLKANVCYWQEKKAGTYAADTFPVFSQVNGMRGTYVYGAPSHEYKGLVKFCFHGGCEIDPDKRDVCDDTGIVKELEDYVRKHLPGLKPKPVIIEPCLYTMTPDEDYILDVHPLWNNIVFGAGFSGHGFKLAPVSGRLLAEMAMKIPPSFEVCHFRINRFTKSKL